MKPSNGGEEKIISKNLKNGLKPVWRATCTFHPNGETLVYSYIREKILFSMNLNTGKVSKLTNSNVKYTYPIFSKDGSKIAVNKSNSDNKGYDLVVINPDGTGAKVISKNVISYSPGAWSYSGSELVFSGMVNGSQQLFKINIATQNEIMLTNKPNFNVKQTWCLCFL